MTSVGPVISGLSVSIIGAGPDGDGGEVIVRGGKEGGREG